MPQGGSYLDKLLLGIKTVEWNGAEMPFRSVVNFLGGTVADNPGNGSTDVSITGSSSGSGGYTTIQVNGNPEPSRIAINFIGLDVSDDETHNRTNVTLDYGNSNATGVLTAPFGGTGVTSLANHGVVLGGGVGPLTTVPSSTDGYVLTLASGIPTWSPLTGTGVTPGTYGDSTHYPTFTVGTDGRVTAASQDALPTMASVVAGAGIGVSGGPAYTVSLSTPVTVARGGTGLATLTTHAVVLGEGTSNVAFATPATAGNYLRDNGASADPTFNTIAYSEISGTPTAVTVAGGTGISVTGGPAYTVSLQTPVTVLDGGTGQNSFVPHAVLLGEGTSAVSSTGPNAATGIPLVSQGTGADPLFGTASVGGGGTGLTTLTAHSALLGEGTSAVGVATPSTAGQALISNGASSDPSFQDITFLHGHLVNTPGVGVVVFDGSQFQFTFPLTSTFGGTDVSSAGAAGNVLTSTGTGWSSAAPTGPLSGSTDVTVSVSGAGITDLGSVTVVVPAGGKLAYIIAFFMSEAAALDQITIGSGVNSGSAFSISNLALIGTFNSGSFLGEATITSVTATTGSVAIHALAQKNTVTATVRALITAWVVT